jgi:hypothetical protein
MRRLIPITLLACLAVFGCGAYVWGPGVGRSMGDDHKRSVRLETVVNRTFPNHPGLEYQLTGRLKDEIATDRRLVLSEGPSEVRLRVSLTRFDEPNLVEDLDTGQPAEILLKATAVVEATGDVFPGGVSRRKVSVSTSYTPLLGDSRSAGLERLWRDLAREIVDVAADEEWASR